MPEGIERFVMPGSPKPRGPYSHAVRAGDFLFISGMGPLDSATNELSLGDIAHETRLTLTNIQRVLEGCGASLAHVVKCSVFLRNIADFAAMNAVYAEFFGDARPARTTVQAVLPGEGMKVEIDCVAYKPL
jgi:2-iminobutanoate/2-iminopropanoate deaminase